MLNTHRNRTWNRTRNNTLGLACAAGVVCAAAIAFISITPVSLATALAAAIVLFTFAISTWGFMIYAGTEGER